VVISTSLEKMHQLALSGLFPLSESAKRFRSAKVKVTHCMQCGLSHEQNCRSLCQTHELWQNERNLCPRSL